MATPETTLAQDSTVSGDPLTGIAEFIGGPRVDDLLRSAAERAPEHVAIHAAASELSYAALDERAGRLARAIHAQLAKPGQVVALAGVLDPAFAVSFFGIARSGAVPALINPLLLADGLVHVLGTSGAVTAIVPPEVHRRLVPVLDRLPELRHIVLTHRDDQTELPGPPTLDEVLASAPDGVLPATACDENSVACLQFTSGTTGAAKAVRLSHRNITVNAAQSGHAHGITPSSVMFNYLPTFHLMHLTMAVTFTATLVLHVGDDVAEAVDAAGHEKATHFYSLPMRLSRLAVHPRLSTLAADALQVILCGGSALPLPSTRALTGRFGVPVVQGYGLQETSPSTHFDSLSCPKTGSSGRPVAGTDCRIADVDSRAVLPVGEKGEIQVRGPQLMLGYLGREPGEDVDPDGWFSTGDVGYVDAEGVLFVVDRIKDVFKCDNWLVSPTEIERVVLSHPGVADCVVLDYPDEFSGSVAYGLVVPKEAGLNPAQLAEFVAERLPYYAHLRHVELTDRIPRSPNGKLQRRALREQVHARNTDGAKEIDRQDRSTTVFTFINRFTVTGDATEFRRLLGQITAHMTAQPGFRSHRLYQSARDEAVFTEIAEWDSAEDHQRATAGKGFREPVGEAMKHATAEPAPFVLRAEHGA